MDDHPDNEDAGLPLWEAFQRYCDPEIVRAWREAGAACGGDLRARRGSKHWKRVQRYYAAERAVVADGLDRLAWFGYLMPRVRGVGLELIPDAVLQARDRKIKGSTVAGIGLEFVGVLVYPAAKSPGAEKALFGQPLSEWYEQFVNDDETGRLMAECTIWHPEWAEILEHEYPGYDVVSLDGVDRDVAGAPSYLALPVRFEKWSSPRKECFISGRIAQIWGTEPDETLDGVPDEIVTLHLRRQELTKALLAKFRDRRLILKGVREYPSPSMDNEPEEIPKRLISRGDITVSFHGNILFRKVRGEPRPVVEFTDLQVFRPRGRFRWVRGGGAA